MLQNDPQDTVFETDKPALSKTQINHLLGELFSISGELTELVSERDQNIKISNDQGNYVLKISNVAEDKEFLELQNQALIHLQEHSEQACTPRVLKGVDGQTLYRYQGQQGHHYLRVLSYLDGTLYSQVDATPALLTSLGTFMGQLSKSLTGFNHRAAHRPNFLWNLDNAINCKAYLPYVKGEKNRQMLNEIMTHYEFEIRPRLSSLRCAVIHQDANDNNLLVKSHQHDQLCGLIDFGDVCFGRQVNDLAITMAYALQGQADLYHASVLIISAYTEQFPLLEDEIEVLFELIKMRLVMSICISSKRIEDYPANEYLLISQQPALQLLQRANQLNTKFMSAVFRKAAGFTASRNFESTYKWLSNSTLHTANMFDVDLKRSPRRVLKLDQNVETSPVENYQDLLTQNDRENNIAYLIGLYGEDRDVYTADQFQSAATPHRRTIHLGQDIFIDALSAVFAPLSGRVFSVSDNNFSLDYGPTVILEHDIGTSGKHFYTLYGHLAKTTLSLLKKDQPITAGQLIGHVGEFHENGGWAPHVHFQIMTSMLGLTDNFNGVAEKSLWSVYKELCPDPNLILRLAPESFDCNVNIARLQKQREQLLGPSLSLSYNKKLNIVRGKGAYLYDHTGREYLDCVNNICHVGHCHPHVLKAMQQQAKILNTNTRYLHQGIVEYSKRLTALFPESLSVAYFVNSGTEANELALRIARTATGVKDTIVLDWGYHGNSSATIEISPYKFKRKGGFAKPDHVQIADCPAPYRSNHPGMSETAAIEYAQSVNACIEAIKKRSSHGPAAFIAESISGVGGQIVYPQGYLKMAYSAIRSAGGVCIADEVQCGFGRVGSHFWAYESQDVIPDIVVLGKPIGNGHPLAAVITTKQLASQFDNGMEYFNSFGGNPVSAAVGMAVLDVIENEQLMHNAKHIGDYLLLNFNKLKDKYKNIGDVRGMGLFLGIELVKDRQSKKPFPELASSIVNELRERAVLLSTDGPDENVLKLKPPMVFSIKDADFLLQQLDCAFDKMA